jgi:hypothetical protein
MQKRISQRELIKKHLNKRGSITSWEAIKLYGCTRLSAKIYDLRNEGMKIRTEHVSKKNRYGYMVTFAKYIRER